jgi:hypothetical protein
MKPCSFIRGNVSEELSTFMFNKGNCVTSLKMQAAVSSGIMVNVYKNKERLIPEDYVNVNRNVCFASRNAYLLS